MEKNKEALRFPEENTSNIVEPALARPRGNILALVTRKKITVTEAARQLGIGRQHCHRLLNLFKQDPRSAEKQPRIRAPAEKFSGEFRKQAIDLYRNKYLSFGMPQACEYMKKHDNISVPPWSLRRWLLSVNIRKVKKQHQPSVHPQRPPRERLGELIQLDGGHHRWFGEKYPQAALLVFVDDSTRKIMAMRFFRTERVEGYWEMMREYLLEYGIPQAIYTDKHVAFSNNSQNARNDACFVRIGKTLNYNVLIASCPQAKGRVERKIKTLQNRYVNFLKHHNITDIATANAHINEFLAEMKQFEIAPQSEVDAHTPLTAEQIASIDDLFYFEHTRKVSHTLTFRFQKKEYFLEAGRSAAALCRRGAIITLRAYADGRLQAIFKDKIISFRDLEIPLVTPHTPQITPPKHLEFALLEGNRLQHIATSHANS